MKLSIPFYVRTVLARLAAGGHEAYAVGGCVRDALDGRVPHDWDVCTSALPEETKACFPGFRVVETGIRHGTVTVLPEEEPVEITTYRVDGAYSDGRHPDAVSFTRSLREDLARRDFTINAMAYRPAEVSAEPAPGETGADAVDTDGELVDPFGGREDLRRRLIRCVGDPNARFSEDALRILRALRFSAVLRCRIEPDTADAARRLRGTLAAVSPERRLVELRKLLTGADAADVLRAFSDVIAAAAPGLPEDAAAKRAETVGRAPCELDVRLAVLLHGLDAQAILHGLRAERALVERVGFLVERMDEPFPSDPPGIRRLLRDAGPDAARSLARTVGADETALNAVLASGGCWSVGQLAVRGADLIKAGLQPGPQLGRTLGALLDAVMDETLPNERTALLDAAVRMAEETPPRG